MILKHKGSFNLSLKLPSNLRKEAALFHIPRLFTRRPYERLQYRSSDNSMTFDFVFWHLSRDEGWRIYIINSVNYGSHDCSSHAAHWLHDYSDTYPYICWAGKINTYNQAKAVASLWADATALYIRPSERRSFDQIVSDLNN